VSFFRQAVIHQITAQQQYVGVLADLGKERSEFAGEITFTMEVGDSGDVNQVVGHACAFSLLDGSCL
jgi:hypothetical protein